MRRFSSLLRSPRLRSTPSDGSEDLPVSLSVTVLSMVRSGCQWIVDNVGVRGSGPPRETGQSQRHTTSAGNGTATGDGTEPPRARRAGALPRSKAPREE